MEYSFVVVPSCKEIKALMEISNFVLAIFDELEFETFADKVSK